MCGYNTIAFPGIHITSVELGMSSSWRAWPYKDRFRQVDTDLRHGLNEQYAFTHADRDKHTMYFYWDELQICDRPFVRNIPDLTADEIAQGIDGDVPSAGWKQLAQGVLDFLDLPNDEA